VDDWVAIEHEGPWRQSLRRLMLNRAAVIGTAVLLLLIVIAVFAPVLAPYDPLKTSLRERLQPPTLQHLMGTDALGRDLLSRVIFGARISLQLGIVSVAIAAIWGTFFGLIAGYYGGVLDTLIARGMDVLLSFPGILLAMSIIAILGPGLLNAMIAVGVSWIAAYARLVRASTMSAKENDYVLAARCLGCSSFHIAVGHILPNILAPLIVLSSLDIGAAILVGASLSFLGLGAQPPAPEWGGILNDGREYIRQAWWTMTFPGLAIMITVMATNLSGDGLREAIDPRLKW
jgi:peptide/nickel transport system permease protein